MTSQSFARRFFLFISCLSLPSAAFASSPTVTVTSPLSGSSPGSPVHFVASASSPGCAGGIAAMRIYTAPLTSVFTVQSSQLDTMVSLLPGNYNTVVQAWDNCGGVGKAALNLTVATAGLLPARFLYLADFANNKILSFHVDPLTGRPSPTPQGSVVTTSSYRLAVDKGGFRLYLTDAGPVPFSRVTGYFIDRRNGALQPVPGSPYLLNASPGPLAVHPSGQFVFVGTLDLQPNDGILVLRVNADGSLSQVNSTPILAKSTPDSMVVDRSGRYLYVISLVGFSIDAFAIDNISGALTPLPGSPYSVTTPGCGEAFPSGAADVNGRYLYTADELPSEISGYAIAGRTGTLTELAKSPFPVSGGCNSHRAGPRALATEPTGRFLYVMNQNNFSIFSINAGNGFLRHLKDTPKAKGEVFFAALAADPSGKFLFAARSPVDGSGDDLSGYAIDPVSGDLNPLAGSPFSIGTRVEVFDLEVTP